MTSHLLTGLQTVSDRLLTASSVESVWQMTLEEVMQRLGADGGAWVWNLPMPKVASLHKSAHLASLEWRELVKCLGEPLEAQCAIVTPTESQHFNTVIVPASVGAWRGWMVLARNGTQFTRDDLTCACSATVIARMAVSGLSRYEDIDEARVRQVQELEILQQMSRAIGESLDLRTTLDVVLEALSSLIAYDAGEITLFDAEQSALITQAYKANENAQRGVDLLGMVYQLDEGFSGWLARTRRPLLIDDVAAFEATEPKSETLKLWSRSFLGIPLIARGELVGTLEIASVEVGQFTEHHLELVELFGGQAAIAIENARLYTQTDVELRRRLEAMEVLQRVTRDITSTIDLDYILNGVLRDAIKFSVADAGLIALIDDTGDMELRAFAGYSEQALDHIRRVVGSATSDSPLAQFLKFQRTVYIPDVHQEQYTELLPVDARALLVAPVFYEERLVAAIMIQSTVPATFSPIVLEFIEGLAAQASIAVGNTHRYNEQLARGELMHRRAEQMSLLLEVTRTMRSDRPLEDVLLDVAYAVQEGIGFNIVLISVLEGNVVRRVAGAGIPLARLNQMKQVRHAWSRIQALFQEQFRIGRCYYIPAEYYDSVMEGLDVFIPSPEDMERQPGAWHQKDTFVIPLRGSRGDIVGIMSIDDPIGGHVPTAQTAEVVEIFAAQVALAIENNRLVEDLRRQVNTLRLFNELNRSITTKLDLPLVLNTVVQSVTNLLDYDYATIFLQDKAGQYFIPLATSGYALDMLASGVYKWGEGLIGSVALTGMPLVVEDVADDVRFRAGPISSGSWMLVPLMTEGRSVGVLAAGRKEKGDFSPIDVATLTALADQVSVAVENARLFDEVKRFSEELEMHVAERTRELAEALEGLRIQRDRSEALYHIAAELVSSLDIDRMLSQALSLLQKAVKASRSAVILLDHSTGRLFYRAAIGHTERTPPGGRAASFGRSEGVVGWVLANKAAVIIPNALEDERCAVVVDAQSRSILAAPILSGTGEALGVILLQSSIENVFNEPELRLVEAAAVQLGSALNNAELYRLIREQAERLGGMLRTQQIEAAKNQAILEGIADGVIVGDAEGQIILFNAAAARILSISREQALNRSLDDILELYGTAARTWVAQIERWRENPGARHDEDFLAHRMEAGRRFVSAHLSPVFSPTREFLGVVAVFRDVTSEVEADRAKSDFVSTVSHELRTPMTSIVGYVDLILMGATGPISDIQNDFLRKVKSNSERLTALVNDLLDISRIETGRIELQLAPVAIEEVIQQVVDLLHPKIEEKAQHLDMVLPSALPKVYGDPDRLAQILTNIVGNACKYTPVDGRIGVYTYVYEGMMRVGVADSGIGIAPENQKKIFQRFYRVEDDPAVYEVSGTGLGLAISLSLIQMHGGEIALESALGKGSIFTFSIPLAAGESIANIGESPPHIITDPKVTILVVEDDRESADLLKIMLQKGDVEFLTASYGEDALRIAREKLPDLISLDIRLPDMSGFEVLQLLKRDVATADIPVVIISVTQDRRRGLRLGAAEYLVKPMDEKRLREVIVRLLTHQATIVIADDDRETLNSLRSALQLQGMKVHTARNVERAQQLACDEEPVVILLAHQLSGIRYDRILEALRQDSRSADIPVIVMAADAPYGEGSVGALEDLRSLQFLTKPFSSEELAARLFYLLSENGVQRSRENG